MAKKIQPRNKLKVLPVSALSELNRALLSVEKKQWNNARETLDALCHRFPRRAEVLGLLVMVCGEQNDATGTMKACRELVEVVPDDGDIWLALAQSYFDNSHPVLALQTFEEFTRRFPDHELAPQIQSEAQKRREAVASLLESAGLSLDEPEFAVLHEEINVYLAVGQPERARQCAEKLLEHKPAFAPALNNLSQIVALEGDYARAIGLCERVLQSAPDNIHALSNIARFCVLGGQMEQAREWAQQLKDSPADGFDGALKRCEALSYVGDDAGVLSIAKAARAKRTVQSPGADAMMAHLAGVAAWRTGNEKDARVWWKRASQSANPIFSTVTENLANLEKPPGERDAPWPFPANQWIRRETIEEFVRDTSASAGPPRAWQAPEVKEKALQQKAERFLQKHPEIEATLPLLLERGDPVARQFALMIAQTARTPTALDALGAFALGPWGTDELRHQAMQTATEAGVVSPGDEGTVLMWSQGQQTEVMLMGFEIHDEAEVRFDAATQKLVKAALEKLHTGDGKAAEPLLREALLRCPDDPALLNNLALAREFQAMRDEAEAMMRDTFARHPDYLYGRVGMARLLTQSGDFEAAHELLKPLMKRKRFHFKEFAAWQSAQTELLIDEGNFEAAERQLALMDDVLAGSPGIAALRRRLNAAQTVAKLATRKPKTRRSGPASLNRPSKRQAFKSTLSEP